MKLLLIMYHLNVESQDYSKYSLIPEDSVNNEKIIYNGPERIIGLFHTQTIEVSNDNWLIREPIIIPQNIVGELELYSKYSFKPNKRGVPAYIFTPINKNYPKCIVNSKIKGKYNKNVLITVDYTNWQKNDKFARGNINRILGEINDVKAIQESMLFKYNLPMNCLKCDFKHITLLFDQLLEKSQDREFITKEIISIDPDGCKDIDDALSIYPKQNNLIIDIHISDVYYLLNNLDILNKVENVTSIYLTDYIKHMLPTIISSNLGSLIEKNIRFMLSIKIVFSPDENRIISTSLRKTFGKIKKNYTYDNYPRKIDKYKRDIENIYTLITKETIKITDSHKLIEALMIIYNTEFCNIIEKQGKKSIYRIQKANNDIHNKIEDSRLDKFLSIIKSRCAEYSYEKVSHATLKINNYTHATSPLRRIVDLINQEIFYTEDQIICDNFSKYNNNQPLEYINQYNNKLKKAYRDINKLVLADTVYNTTEYISECYIYCVKNDKIYLYFPKENLSIKTSIIHKKLGHLYQTIIDNNSLYIKESDDTVVNIFKLNTLLNVKINGKPNIHYPDKSIVIEFENIQME